jgi:hypothetical protein
VEIKQTADARRPSKIGFLVVVIALGSGCVQQPNVSTYSSRSTDPYAARRWSSPAFSPAHESLTEAAKHFVGVRAEPRQPIEFPHNIHHLNEIGIDCQDCHTGVKTGPRAGIPSVTFCMTCHEDIGDASDTRIQMLRAHAKRGEDIRWERVYGFFEESHVRFNHSPHIRAGVECSTCHGDVTQMTVVQRTVEHTMKFCIDCHKQKGASEDCLTCHY